MSIKPICGCRMYYGRWIECDPCKEYTAALHHKARLEHIADMRARDPQYVPVSPPDPNQEVV